MRYSILAVAPFVAAAFAQTESSVTSGVQSSSSSVSYSNFETQFTTETNSYGVVTGMPTAASFSDGVDATSAVTSEPAAVTSEPAKATVPAGLTAGLYTISYGNGTGLTTFTVSVGSSTTAVLSVTSSTSTTGGAAGTTHGSGTAASGSATASATSSTSSSAADANSIQLASAAVFGLGAVFVALL